MRTQRKLQGVPACSWRAGWRLRGGSLGLGARRPADWRGNTWVWTDPGSVCERCLISDEHVRVWCWVTGLIPAQQKKKHWEFLDENRVKHCSSVTSDYNNTNDQIIPNSNCQTRETLLRQLILSAGNFLFFGFYQTTLRIFTHFHLVEKERKS